MSSRTLLTRIACLLLAGTLAASVAHAQGRAVAPPLPRSDAGDWIGTWYYVNRDVRLVLWMRVEQGLPQIKLRYLGLSTLEGFESDWQGKASYDFEGYPGLFSLEPTERDANTIKGKWSWELTKDKAYRLETADVTLYRAGDGRQLVIRFDQYKKVLRAGEESIEIGSDFSWSLRKASSRLVRWDELPF